MRLVLALLILVAATAAKAHHAPSGFQYEAFCCNGNGENGDCQPIPSQAVRPAGGGYQIALKPGDHRLVTRPHLFLVPQSRALESPDGQFHLCLFPNEDTVRCFYAPPLNF
ncbi:hypothetical protein [Rhizobium sp. BK399]|uniref:hypothetical protein n=1 Tax=Rhizobium sp. BK399 TaxID=2587063 RepID=UPI001FF06389|nr:hypothetical protein [Rhizobium sp. BK399]